jgi:hypothetical protein
MKISNGRGTPIWVKPRENGDGCLLFQGKSHVMVNNSEIAPVIAALQALQAPNQT